MNIAFDFFKALNLMELAGFDVHSIDKMPNGYWPLAYKEARAMSPWFLVRTSLGPITIGWRKRVIQIEWDKRMYSGIITEDDTTKEDTMVHAWGYPDAAKYLENLRKAVTSQRIKEQEERGNAHTNLSEQGST